MGKSRLRLLLFEDLVLTTMCTNARDLEASIKDTKMSKLHESIYQQILFASLRLIL